jgi:hypothetical protein
MIAEVKQHSQRFRMDDDLDLFSGALPCADDTLSCWSQLHLQLVPNNTHWIRVVSYGPLSPSCFFKSIRNNGGDIVTILTFSMLRKAR